VRDAEGYEIFTKFVSKFIFQLKCPRSRVIPERHFSGSEEIVTIWAWMPNRNLSPEELLRANELLATIREQLRILADGDPHLLFAFRRKVAKELGYDERGKPGARGKLKALQWGRQNGKCAHCGKDLPLSYSELDRKNAVDGYTQENTDLVHGECHRERQAAKRYT